MEVKDFLKIVDEHNNGKSYGLCPQPFPSDKGLGVLIEHFLGEDWYVATPLGSEQVYTEAICCILEKYPRRKSIFIRFVEFLKCKAK